MKLRYIVTILVASALLVLSGCRPSVKEESPTEVLTEAESEITEPATEEETESETEPETELVAESRDVDVLKTMKIDDGWTDDGRPSVRRANFDYKESEREKMIFSYVQGREEYYEDPTWCGPWAYIEKGGQGFYAFGCGICCLSNMVNTLSHPKNTPSEMLDMAKECTDYYPESGTGALSWEQLKTVCENYELTAQMREKPEDYEEFQYQINTADTAVVLICSYNDDKLWSHTGGHYVNIWEYDPASDTVFVTDSSGLYNRVRVALTDIYAALKTSSPSQYMTVSAR